MNKNNSYKKTHYWIHGLHAVKAALNNHSRKCLNMILTKDQYDNFNLYKISKEFFSYDEISNILQINSNHQGVAVKVKYLDYSLLDVLKKTGKSSLIILDQITDPQNLGAILRSAAAFGIDAVIITGDNSVNETPIVAKIASGGLDIVPLITVANLVTTISKLKKEGYWCFGLDAAATQTISQNFFSDKVALILGSEEKGLRKLVRENCDLLFNIPINNKMESLNVSTAGAIAMYELYKFFNNNIC